MKKTFMLTRERLRELEDELSYLKTVKEREVAEQIKEARAFGDLSENSEYNEAKNEQGKLYSRIAEVESVLSNYEILESVNEGVDTVVIGCHVAVRDDADGEELRYSIVGTQEANPSKSRISDESPFGKALMGHKTGDQVVFEAEAGTFTYTIIEISA
ncbi:MAG: transcription elongation factor GreA [Oscillospiraceae bacterium]|nr:transcription elongation factor GreA [Oscillospiraceae bacterium]